MPPAPAQTWRRLFNSRPTSLRACKAVEPRSRREWHHRPLVKPFRRAQAPLTLLQLPAEVIANLLVQLDVRSMLRIAATCSKIFRGPTAPVEEALRQRAASRGRVFPDSLPQSFSSRAAHLAWLDCRRDEALAPAADGRLSSLFL